MGCTVIGLGKALPRKVVTNDEMSAIVDTSDEWISSRTGIHARHIAVNESSTDLGSAAIASALGMPAEAALPTLPASDDAAGEDAAAASLPEPEIDTTSWLGEAVDPKSIDLLICMTVSPDATIPSQAALIKERLGMDNAVAFDLNAACAGCVYGITVAESMMAASNSAAGAVGNTVRRAVVVGVERLSRITDWSDRSTCVLFGDGAGCVVLEWSNEKAGVLSTFMKNTDDTNRTLTRANIFDNSTFPFGDADGALAPVGTSAFIGMKGQAVFKFATNSLIEATHAVVDRAGANIDDVKLIVPHQANERIIKYTAKKLGKPESLFQLSIGDSANTSAASALMALCDAYSEGKVAAGDKVVMVGFGGGLTAGAVLFEA